MRKILLLAASLAVLSCLAAAQDAETLQQTLAKIVFAHQVGVLYHAVPVGNQPKISAAEVQQMLNQNALQLTASDITTGTTSTIMKRPLAELVTALPDGRMLHVGNATTLVSNEHGVIGIQREAPVEWEKYGAPPLPSSLTLSDGIAKEPYYGGCNRYLTATMSATYAGESAQWKALYLTSCTDGKIRAVDLVMPDEAVPIFWGEDVYPYGLMQAPRAQNPAVQEWLKNNASATCGSKTCIEGGRVVIPQKDVPTVAPITSVPQPLPFQQYQQHKLCG
jgi:hypothetical protein